MILTCEQALKSLSEYPPLVTPTEICKLRSKLRDVALNRAFLLQGGDCAEAFSYTAKEPIEAKLKVLLQMSLVLVWGAKVPVVRIARMAGQYAKPRSSPTEKLPDGTVVQSFKGENINGYDPGNREPDPNRLVQAYFHSAATLNYTRALLSSGFADLHSPEKWLLGHVKDENLMKKYRSITESVLDCLNFVKVIGAENQQSMENVDLFTSHEALLLDYETAMTKYDIQSDCWYDTSAHFIWVGERTRQIDHGHIEFIRGVENPIGIKVGPTMSPDELVSVLDLVDPDMEPGRVTLITRYGATKVEEVLPAHIAAVQASGHIPVWCSDPMHGNTKVSNSNPNLKTRYFTDIVSELEKCFQVHAECKNWLNGLHFELTGEVGITECVGGSMEIQDEELEKGFKSFCDPR